MNNVIEALIDLQTQFLIHTGNHAIKLIVLDKTAYDILTLSIHDQYKYATPHLKYVYDEVILNGPGGPTKIQRSEPYKDMSLWTNDGLFERKR